MEPRILCSRFLSHDSSPGDQLAVVLLNWTLPSITPQLWHRGSLCGHRLQLLARQTSLATCGAACLHAAHVSGAPGLRPPIATRGTNQPPVLAAPAVLQQRCACVQTAAPTGCMTSCP